MKNLVIAPHPDDETLGCGGTLLRQKDEGDEIYWIIVTSITKELGYPNEQVLNRESEIKNVSKKYGFKEVFNFSFPPTLVDTIPIADLIHKIVDVYHKVEPDVIFMPYNNDVHTDHQVIAKALQSTFKWFRYPYIKKVLMYETLSETEFNFMIENTFKPNLFIDMAQYLDSKIDIMKTYKSEIDKFPFPRSEKAIRALATYRGSQAGFSAAEAFKLVYNKIG